MKNMCMLMGERNGEEGKERGGGKREKEGEEEQVRGKEGEDQQVVWCIEG